VKATSRAPLALFWAVLLALGVLLCGSPERTVRALQPGGVYMAVSLMAFWVSSRRLSRPRASLQPVKLLPGPPGWHRPDRCGRGGGPARNRHIIRRAWAHRTARVLDKATPDASQTAHGPGVTRTGCATKRSAISPVQRAEMRGGISGSDG